MIYLDKKQNSLTINTTNKNDIINLLGPPSTKSRFDNDMWIYIERKTSKFSDAENRLLLTHIV